MSPALPLLEMENVTLLREGRRALNGVSLTVLRGENVAILGANGSGKSSLLKLLTRDLYPHPSSGTFRLLGRTRWDVRSLRGQLGIVSNDLQAHLDPKLTASAAVATGTTGHLSHFDSFDSAAVSDALARANACHLADRRLETLSSGESRRVLLARALAHSPHTLVLDEPSTSLDLAASHEFLSVVRELAHRGIGLLLVTHHFEEILPEISRVILIRQGRVFADGPREEVMNEQNLSDAFGVRVRLTGNGPYSAHVVP